MKRTNTILWAVLVIVVCVALATWLRAHLNSPRESAKRLVKRLDSGDLTPSWLGKLWGKEGLAYYRARFTLAEFGEPAVRVLIGYED